jgi:hypothetical protein
MTITSENLATAIVKLVAVDALPALMGEFIMANLVYRDFEPSIAQVGDVVELSARSEVIALDTHAEAQFQIPDVTKVLAVPDLLKLYMQPAVIALAEKIETDLLKLALQFSANSPVGVAATPITEATVDAAETALYDAKVPCSMAKYLVVDSSTYSQLRQTPRFSEYGSAWEAGLKAIINGPVGKIRDFFVLRSRLVQKGGYPVVTTNNVAFTRDALGLVTRRLPQPLRGTGDIAEYAEMGNFGVRVLMKYLPNTLSQQFTIDVLYGAAVLRNDHGVIVRS